MHMENVETVDWKTQLGLNSANICLSGYLQHRWRVQQILRLQEEALVQILIRKLLQQLDVVHAVCYGGNFL